VNRYLGRSVRRREDATLITGRGRYATDLPMEGLCHLAVVRSPIGHGQVAGIDLEFVRSMPGVLLAWSAAELPEVGCGMMAAPSGMKTVEHPILAIKEVCYAGQPLAIVLAEEEGQAADALDAVGLDLIALPAAVDLEKASQDRPLAHSDLASNVAARLTRGFGDVGAAFRRASVTIRCEFSLARVSGGYIEPRSATARPDGPRRVTVWSSTQSVYGVRETVARVLGLAESDVTVLAEDVGGGFGGKGVSYPEDVLAAAACLRVQRPVRWTGGRRDDTQASIQAHGQRIELELAADRDGAVLGIRGRVLYDLGAYLLTGLAQIDNIASHFIGPYGLPALELEFLLTHTNTAPTGFIRGGGREIGNYCSERLMDFLADRLELGRIEIRRRNLVGRSQMPRITGYSTPAGPVVHDGGDRERLMELAVGAVDVNEVRRRRSVGRAVGVGLAMCVESTGVGAAETARVSIEPDGTAVVQVGSTPHGQGHATTFSQVAAEHLGWDLDKVTVQLGNTSTIPFSGVIGASRSAVEFGNAIALAARSARQRLFERAASLLEADPADLEVGVAGIHVRGAPSRTAGFASLVGADGLGVEEVYDPFGSKSYASGAHVAVVEVDLETGAVRVDRYIAAHDVGRPINPMVIAGQIHGGIVHGLGYALFEEAVYDPAGNLTTATFADYMVPSMPEVGFTPDLLHHDVPAGNPEGYRGVGESGTIPAAAAISAAIEDALRSAGRPVTLNQLPVSPALIHELLSSTVEVAH
jgi:carbon-monoxide dehydrogenase large subunit